MVGREARGAGRETGGCLKKEDKRAVFVSEERRGTNHLNGLFSMIALLPSSILCNNSFSTSNSSLDRATPLPIFARSSPAQPPQNTTTKSLEDMVAFYAVFGGTYRVLREGVTQLQRGWLATSAPQRTAGAIPLAQRTISNVQS